MSSNIVRVETTPKTGEGMRDVRGDSVKRQLEADHSIKIDSVRSIVGFLIDSEITSEEVSSRVDDVFADPIIEESATDSLHLDNSELFSESPDITVTIGFKAGVTDNPGKAALDGFLTIFPEAGEDARVSTYITYVFQGVPDDVEADWLSKQLHNGLIERALYSTKGEKSPEIEYIPVAAIEYTPPATIDLEISDDDLIKLSEEGLLALNLEEMQTIQAHYRDSEVRASRVAVGLPENAPTDVELECLAQTWSEHCKHKIFAAHIHHVDTETGEDTEIDSLFKTHIMNPTLEMKDEVDWLLSVFHDNSGVIAWDDEWSICMKAETHNSPSALDPYGGAMTGIVGVNRDILGTGLGARPIANTDVFCFGPPDWEGDLPDNLFHPSRVLRGVHAGVRVGGNESGIPTVNGAIVFDDRYIGKPLVTVVQLV